MLYILVAKPGDHFIHQLIREKLKRNCFGLAEMLISTG